MRRWLTVGMCTGLGVVGWLAGPYLYSLPPSEEGITFQKVLVGKLLQQDIALSLVLILSALAAGFVYGCLVGYGQRRGLASAADLSRAERAFDFVKLLIPKRLYNEDLGDALEVISRMAANAEPRWKVDLKIGSTVLWALVNAAREMASVFAKKSSGR